MDRWSRPASSGSKRSSSADAARSRTIRLVMRQAAALRPVQPSDAEADRRARFRRSAS
jgi:hypothetical protein